MNEPPLISVCIPAYKNTAYLQRLFDSIAIQTYTHVEVIVTDDSPDDAVEQFVKAYKRISNLRYFRNEAALGTPENWNESIRKARGEWIKLMHDDDWFAGPASLSHFAAAIQPGKNFIFSAYENVYEGSDAIKTMKASRLYRMMLANSPVALLSRNLIGPPSVTLYRKTALEYDKRMKWRVDIDFYIHYLQTNAFVYLNRPLVKVGISREQVTQSCFLVPEVEIPETFLLFEKLGFKHLRNWIVYDAWWRLLRNLNISTEAQIKTSGFHGTLPAVIRAMLKDQRQLPARFLKWGVISKVSMFVSYLRRLPLIH